MPKILSLSNVEALLSRSASRFVSTDEALYFTKEQIDTHIKKSPRTNPLKEAVGDLSSWEERSSSEMEVQVDKGPSLLLNFNGLGPSLKLKYIHDTLENRATANGIAAVGINNSAGIHTLNLWTDGLGKRDMIGICFFNGGPDGVVPYGGTKGIFGTNPISYAIPTADRPIIVDMATSEIPYFEIKNAKAEGKELKEGAAVDQEGNPTTDPAKVLNDSGVSNLLPMGGGYKGYALVLLVEILTGSLVRSFLSTEMTSEYISEEHGGLLLAIDIASFTDLNKFKQSVTEMCGQVRAQKPTSGVERITIPGDRSYEREAKVRAAGEISIDSELLEKLQRLALG